MGVEGYLLALDRPGAHHAHKGDLGLQGGAGIGTRRGGWDNILYILTLYGALIGKRGNLWFY